MSATLDTTLRRNDELLHAPVGTDEAVMMSIEAGKYYGVNAVGARIWDLLETPQPISRLCAKICEEFDVDPVTCEEAVLKFADDLIENGVVHTSAI
jgi:hypothetical protein